MSIIVHFFCDPQTDNNICIEILKIIKQIFANILPLYTFKLLSRVQFNLFNKRLDFNR